MVKLLKRIERIDNKVILEFNSEQEAILFLQLLGLGEAATPGISPRGYQVAGSIPLEIKIQWPKLKNKYIEYLKHKPRKPVTDIDTVNDYIASIEKFIECSNGIISPETIIKCIKNKHYSTAIRNLLHMLYYYKLINKEVYREFLERIPKFHTNKTISIDYIELSKVLYSLARVESLKRPYRLLYHALYYAAGPRLEQLINSLKEPEITSINRSYSRIKLKGSGTKTAVYAWLPNNLLNKLLKYKPTAKPRTIRDKYRKKGLITPSLIRSFCWQTAKQLFKEDIALMLQGRIGELKKRVTSTSYDNLIFQVDTLYKRWLKFIDELESFKTTDIEKAKIHAQALKDKYRLIIPI